MSTIEQQLTFLIEIDKLKGVHRQSSVLDGRRRENSAEHSWHLAMFAVSLLEHAAPDVDPWHAVRLLLIHDIVEIDAGDAPLHSPTTDVALQADLEQRAAVRIFGLLPPAQGARMLADWQEFEQGSTPSARFAKALDRLQPLLLNTLTGGGTWIENNVSEEQVLARYGPAISSASPALWAEAKRRVRNCFAAMRGPGGTQLP